MKDELFLHALEAYDVHVHEAMARLPSWRPWDAGERRTIVGAARTALGIRDEWIPAIQVETVRSLDYGTFRIDCLASHSWDGVAGAADLYLPEPVPNRASPFLLLCCGHGGGGKRHPGYQAMARHLCRQGAIVLVPDNIGQGERLPMGHRSCPAAFAAGASVQGLIVMETLGWLAWVRCDRRVDTERMGVLGNSGGGTLALFLAALAPGLAAVSSSGYPSSFEYVARKEKVHCHCNVLPGMLGRLEMWQLLGCFAPKPLLIFQGLNDNLFPADVFWATAERVRRVYRNLDAEDRFRAETLVGTHSWTGLSRELNGRFFAEVFGLTHGPVREDDDLLHHDSATREPWPEDALTTHQLVERLSGVTVDEDVTLARLYPPRIARDVLAGERFCRGEAEEILAQLECWLSETRHPASRMQK